jgi:Protein of unknown function (DUF3455)
LPQVAQAAPGPIQVPAGNKVFLIGHDIGVQIYSCNATAGGFTWGFVALRANLYPDNGKLIITHFGGPALQATDGSSVVGRVEASVTVAAAAIPWLRPSAAGLGGDRLADTTCIQRIATTGGLAPPAAQCTAATAGTVAEVPYTADYYFWKHAGA